MIKKQAVEPDLTALSDKRVFIETYGCRYNFGSTAKLTEILKNNRCTIAATPEDADAVIINTCSVVAPTERKMLRRLSAFRDRNLYVTGCMPEVQREAILAVCSPIFIPDASIQEQYRNAQTIPPGPVGIVQIARGCSGKCSYCITRLARGSLKSVPLSEIVRQVIAYSEAGSVEIQLTAQDTSAWGRDLGMSLPDLLHAIGDIEGAFHVRVGMMNPATLIDIIDDLVPAYAAENLFQFIHVPVQSGSDTILQRMERGYRIDDFEQIIASFRRRYPGINVATDMIVGFSGETAEDQDASVALLGRLRFNKVNVTRFSRRPCTQAFLLPDTPDSIKKERSRILQRCADEISLNLHKQYVGSSLPFIVTEQIRRGSVMARTPSYLGVVLPEELPVGISGIAEITGAETHFLRGRGIRVS